MSPAGMGFYGGKASKCVVLVAFVSSIVSCTTLADRRREQAEKQRTKMVEDLTKSLDAVYADRLRPVASTLLGRLSDDEILSPHADTLTKSLAKHAVGDAEMVLARLSSAVADGDSRSANEAALLLLEICVSPHPAFVITLGHTTIDDIVTELGKPSHDFADPGRHGQRYVVFTSPSGVYRLQSQSASGRKRLHPPVLKSVPHFLVCVADSEGRAIDCRVEVGVSVTLRIFAQDTPLGVSGACGVQWEEFAERLTVTSPVVKEFLITAILDNGVEAYCLSLVYQRNSEVVGVDSGVLRSLRASWEVSDAFWDHGPSMVVTTDAGIEMAWEKVSEWGRGTSSCRMQYSAVVSEALLRGWLQRPLRFQKPNSNKVYELPRPLIMGFLERLSGEKGARNL